MGNKKINILVLASTFPTFSSDDATPSFVWDLTRKMQEIGQKQVQFHILTPNVKNAEKYEERLGVKIHRFKYFFHSELETLCDGAMTSNIKHYPWRAIQLPFFFIFFLIGTMNLIRREGITKIHAHWIIPQAFIAVLAIKILQRKDIEILCTSHGVDLFGLRQDFWMKIKRYTLNNVSKISVVSRRLKEEALMLCTRKKIKVIPMGVDDKKYTPKKKIEAHKQTKEGKNYLFVGRLVEKKGIIESINWYKENKTKGSQLQVIGDGPLMSKIEKITRNDPDIKMIGKKANHEIVKYYRKADYLLFMPVKTKSGDTDSVGLVIIESLLCGVQIITKYPLHDCFLEIKDNCNCKVKKINGGNYATVNNSSIDQVTIFYGLDQIGKKYLKLIQNK